MKYLSTVIYVQLIFAMSCFYAVFFFLRHQNNIVMKWRGKMSWKGSWHYNEHRINWSSSMEYKTVKKKKNKENNGVVMYLALSYRPTIKQSLRRKEKWTTNKLFFWVIGRSKGRSISFFQCAPWVENHPWSSQNRNKSIFYILNSEGVPQRFMCHLSLLCKEHTNATQR